MAEAVLLERQVVVPAGSTVLKGLTKEHADAAEAQPPRVIRRAQAEVATRPYEVELPDLVSAPSERLDLADVSEKRVEPRAARSLDALLAERDEEWEARLNDHIASATEEAYARGYADATARFETEVVEQRNALLADLENLRARWDAFLEQMEPRLAELSFEIAQAVLDAPLPPNMKGVAARAITESVEQMAGSAPIEILLHPVDFLRLQESGVVEQLESLHTGLRWEPRPDMKLGDWVVQSPVMTVRRLEEELLATLKSRLGLLAVVEKERTHPK